MFVKRLILSSCIFMILVFPSPCVSSYLIHFKGDGKLATPRYWEEKGRVYFYYEGGIAGVERGDVDGIERYDETREELDISSPSEEAREEPFVPSEMKDAQQSEIIAQTSEKGEPATIEAYKSEKDRLTDELEQLLEKLREATSRKDEQAKASIKQEIRAVSGQIYDLTDKAKKINKGQLPEKWWGR